MDHLNWRAYLQKERKQSDKRMSFMPLKEQRRLWQHACAKWQTAGYLTSWLIRVRSVTDLTLINQHLCAFKVNSDYSFQLSSKKNTAFFYNSVYNVHSVGQRRFCVCKFACSFVCVEAKDEDNKQESNWKLFFLSWFWNWWSRRPLMDWWPAHGVPHIPLSDGWDKHHHPRGPQRING